MTEIGENGEEKEKSEEEVEVSGFRSDEVGEYASSRLILDVGADITAGRFRRRKGFRVTFLTFASVTAGVEASTGLTASTAVAVVSSSFGTASAPDLVRQ